MAVQIGEVEVMPQQPQQPRDGQQNAAAPPGADAPKPELVHEIAQTVSLLHSRDLRLAAS
jgi:hypothetical protein